MKASWLFSKHPLLVDQELATVIGLNEAIVLQQLNYWLHSKSAKKIDDKWWIYNTYESWKKQNFPFWSVATIRRTFSSLEKKEVVVSANFNRAGFDKTKWYSIDETKLNQLMSSACDQNEQTISSNRADRTDQNDHTYTRDYTETTSDTNKNNDKSQMTYQQSRSTKKEDKSESIPYQQIIDYLNQKTGAHYKPSSKANQRLIKARFKEGYKLDDFKTVIDNKAFDWQGTPYWKYMRPSTLFGASKFDGYLNANNLNQTRNTPASGGYGGTVDISSIPDD
ncbi:hypothetical protein EJK17_11175, partial [Lactobacillus xujianguonis]